MASKVNAYPEIRIPSPIKQTWQAYKESPISMAAFGGLTVLLLVIILGPSFSSHDPMHQDPNMLLQPPSWATKGNITHFFGTDDLGRDILARLIHGARLTVGCAFIATFIAMLLRGTLGVLAGMSRGIKSSILHHMLDMLLSIPSLLLAIVLVAIWGPSLTNATLAITLALLPQFVRATYNAVSNERQKEYIVAVRLDGSPPLRILRLAILPNIVDILVGQTTRALSTAILDISAICFLGLGAQASEPEWGSMMADGMDFIYVGSWTVTLPGLAILCSVLATNLVGDGLRRALQKGID